MAVLTANKERAFSAGATAVPVGAYLRKNAAWILLAAAGWVALFWPTLCGLFQYWLEDPDYSHGFLIPVISAAILLRSRGRLSLVEVKGSAKGLFALLASLVLLALGALSYTNILERLAAWFALVSAIWFLLGSESVWRQRFPLVFLLLSIPPPFFLLGSFRLALKGIATRLSADILSILGYQAFAEGSVLSLGEHQLEVADACSGIRSMMAIIATAILFAHVFRCGVGKGTLLTLTAVPVTLVVNVLRILLISVALVSFDLDLTHGVRHEVVGFGVFGLSLAFLYGALRFYDWLFQWRAKDGGS